MNFQKPINILIVEDEFLIRQMIRAQLERLGHTVIGEALDGQEAVELSQKLGPDVILMDIEMPRLNGLEATQLIYDLCPTPVVILTAYDNPELVREAGEVGAGAYLVKMPSNREIERAIMIAMARFEDMMNLRRLNAELRLRNEELEAALSQVKRLGGLLPICANCKKIRDDKGYWQDVAVYVRDHSEAEFSHSICPDCVELLYPGLLDDQ